MNWDHVYLLVLAVTAISLLATERAPMSMVGLGMILGVAIWPGLVSAKEAIAGFANPAVITVAALYVVGEGFLRTGAASMLANRVLHSTGGKQLTILLLITVMAAVLSAFVNNTLVVVTFMPVITTICRDTGIAPSKLMIPLSYASILGGMCTLVGTSTNILVDGVLREHGKEGISMFEMSPVGIILAGAGILYLAFFSKKLLPNVPSLASQAGAENVQEFVTEITVSKDSSLIGMTMPEVAQSMVDEGMVEGGPRPVLLVRDEALITPPFADTRVQAKDALMVSGPVQELATLNRKGVTHGNAEEGDHYDPRTMTFFELSLTPASGLVGRKIRYLHLKEDHGAAVAGVLRAGRHLRERFADLTLSHGDVLLAFGDDRSKSSLRRSSDYHLIEGIDTGIYHKEKAPIALAIILTVVALFVSGALSIVIAALIGAFAMVATGCLNARQAHHAVNWALLAFLAGTLALSRAAENSGANVLLAQLINDSLGGMGPVFILGGLFLLSIILTETLSNNAVAIILTPVAIAVAEASGMNYRPLVLAVAFGASCCFANPFAYQTNLLVFGPGGYRFRDYLRVGLPLDLLLGAVGITTLSLFWQL